MKVAVIEPGKDADIRDVEVTLEWLQQQVGGYIEAVTLPDAVMWVNEEGKLKQLPANPVASAIARPHIWSDVIVGTAVLTGPADDEGNETELPTEWVELLTR